MFSKLFDFFAKWFDVIVKFLHSGFGVISYILCAGFAGILAFLTFAKSMLLLVNKFLYWIAASISQIGVSTGLTGGLTDSYQASGLVNALGLMNTFFPLVEMFGCMLALMTLAIALAVYGFVKSWIPTVSG